MEVVKSSLAADSQAITHPTAIPLLTSPALFKTEYHTL